MGPLLGTGLKVWTNWLLECVDQEDKAGILEDMGGTTKNCFMITNYGADSGTRNPDLEDHWCGWKL